MFIGVLLYLFKRNSWRKRTFSLGFFQKNMVNPTLLKKKVSKYRNNTVYLQPFNTS